MTKHIRESYRLRDVKASKLAGCRAMSLIEVVGIVDVLTILACLLLPRVAVYTGLRSEGLAALLWGDSGEWREWRDSNP